MAIKTISLELDVYEKLKRAKRGRESFSAVIQRAINSTRREAPASRS
jgi:predicted CopG family antitoxin